MYKGFNNAILSYALLQRRLSSQNAIRAYKTAHNFTHLTSHQREPWRCIHLTSKAHTPIPLAQIQNPRPGVKNEMPCDYTI